MSIPLSKASNCEVDNHLDEVKNQVLFISATIYYELKKSFSEQRNIQAKILVNRSFIACVQKNTCRVNVKVLPISDSFTSFSFRKKGNSPELTMFLSWYRIRGKYAHDANLGSEFRWPPEKGHLQ